MIEMLSKEERYHLELCNRINELLIDNERKDAKIKELEMLYNVSMNNCIAMENDIQELCVDIVVLETKLTARDEEINEYGEDWFELLDENSRLKLRVDWLENAYYNLSCRYDSSDDEIEITVDNIDDI